MGLAFAIINGALAAIEGSDTDWRAIVAKAAIEGLVYGALMGPLVVWLRQRARAATGDVSDDQLARAARAVGRGPVPADPETRRTAYQLATHQLGQQRRSRVLMLISVGLFLAMGTYTALAVSPWYWLFDAFFLALLVAYFWLVARLRRRVELLRPDDA